MLRSKAEALTSDAETKPVSIETPAIEETEKPQNNPEPAVEEASKQQENNDLKELEKAFEEQKTEPAVETTELKQDTETEQAKNQAEELRKFIEGAEVLKQQAAESTEAETQSPVEEKIKEEDKLIVPVPIRRTEVVSGSTEKEQKLSDYAEKLAEKSIQNLGIDSKWIEGNPKVSVALTPEEITTLDEAFKYVGEYFIKQELSSVDPTVNLSNRREYMENIGENMRKGLTHRFTNMVMFGDSWGIKGNLCLRLIINKESPKNIFKNMEDYAVISGEDVEKFVRPFADKFQGIKAELDLFLQDESEKERVRKLTGQGQEITEEQKIQKLRERDRLAQILSDRNQTEDTIIPNEIAEVKKKRSWREWAREKLGNILDM